MFGEVFINHLPWDVYFDPESLEYIKKNGKQRNSKQTVPKFNVARLTFQLLFTCIPFRKIFGLLILNDFFPKVLEKCSWCHLSSIKTAFRYQPALSLIICPSSNILGMDERNWKPSVHEKDSSWKLFSENIFVLL